MNKENNPFVELSNIFIDNQRQLNAKAEDLKNRASALKSKLSVLVEQIDNDVFATDLVQLLNIENESSLLLTVAKELEFQRESILNSIKLLKKSKQIKLNK